MQRADLELLIDLSERDDGIALAERFGVPVWFLCHGPDFRTDLCDSIKSGFVLHEPFIEVRLVEWRAETGTARIVCLYRLRSRKTIGRSIAGVKEAAVDWFTENLSRRGNNLYFDNRDIQLTSGDAPSSWRLVAATLPNLVRIVADLFAVEEWNVGTASGTPENIFNGELMSRVQWLPPNPRFCFRADPFGWRNGQGKIVLLYEIFDFKEGRGCIVRNIDGAEEIIGDFPYHASYPFLIEENGQRYAIPELSEMASPTAYPVDSNSPKWPNGGRPLKGLEGVPLVDGTIFYHEERYWLFGTRSDSEPNAVLHAWYASSCFGPWIPHKQNPIKFDITSSRPGGTPFLWRGQMVRPAQDCSTTYGAAIVLNQIETLTPNEFKETPIARIEPDLNSRYPTGLHTINVIDGLIILDAKRHVPHLLAPYYRWREVFLSRRRAKTLPRK
ncbi:MAG: hypothetical protein RIA64_12970 [Rhodospirillales bacterium]